MRHTYELSHESRKVLSGNVKTVADEMEVNDKYIYAILAGTETDPFAKFVHLYKAAARAGAPVCHFQNRLREIDHRCLRLMPPKTVIECLTAKISADAETTRQLVDAMQDGQVDETERERIRIAIAAERQNLDVLEMTLNLR